MAKLFVSYSRRDSAAARKLIEAFKSIEQEVWVDWESIPPAVDWLEQIFRGIESADAFIFMISPDSIASEVCNVEIGRAALNNKRIIPIVLRDVDPKTTNENIRKLNWTFLRETDNFDEGLAKVKTAIELDLDWLEEHRRLQVRALEWHRKKDVSLLLHGRDLRNALHMVETATSKDPTPTELQTKYIDHSKRTERNRTVAWIATGIAVVALAILSYTAVKASQVAIVNEAEAVKQKQVAEDNAALAILNQHKADENAQAALAEKEIADQQRLIAQAQRSAAKAQIYQIRTGELYTSTLLAIDSWQKSPSDEVEEILRKNISLLPLPVEQVNQGDSVSGLELSPDGNAFLTTSADGKTCVRSVEDGIDLVCTTSSTPVNDAIFVRGGKSIAIAAESGIVQILKVENGIEERKFEGVSPVRDLDIDPDGKTLVIAREDGNITIVDIENTKDKGYNLKLTGKLTVADLSPNGQWVAAGSETGTVTVWNLDTGKIFSPAGHKGAVLTICFSPNSRFAISGGADNYAVGFDTQTSQEIFHLLHSDWVRDIAFAPGGSWFATASDDARVRVWDLSSARERLIMFQDGAITEVKISSNGKWIATTGEDDTVRVWSAYTGVEIFQIPLENHGAALGFSSNNQHLFSSDGAGNISIWDVSEMIAPTGYVQFDKLTWISKFAPTGDTLVASDANRFWLLKPKELSNLEARPPGNSAFEFKNDIYDLVISPDSQLIGISTYADEYIIYNLKTQIPLRITPSGEAYALAFSSDGSRFITGTTNGDIEIWNAKTGAQITSVSEGSSILSIAASPAGIALGTTDKVIVLDANAEQKIVELPSPGENQFVAFNADGSMLASANKSAQVQTWKLENGKFESLNLITGNSEQPYSIAFNPAGNVLAVATINNVYIIDPISGDELSRIPHKGIVYNVSFSPDGNMLATASLKVVQLWDVSTLQKLYADDLVETACSRLSQNFSNSQWNAMFGEEPYRDLCEGLPIAE